MIFFLCLICFCAGLDFALMFLVPFYLEEFTPMIINPYFVLLTLFFRQRSRNLGHAQSKMFVTAVKYLVKIRSLGQISFHMRCSKWVLLVHRRYMFWCFRIYPDLGDSRHHLDAKVWACEVRRRCTGLVLLCVIVHLITNLQLCN